MFTDDRQGRLAVGGEKVGGRMLPAQRRARIVQLTRAHEAVRVVDLMSELGVSDATVRRDLETLAAEGLVSKVHGGAIASAAPSHGAAPEEPAADRIEIGALIPRGAYYSSRILDGIRQAADDPAGRFAVNLALSDGSTSTEHALIATLIEHGVDGLLLMPTVPAEEITDYANWLRTLPVPVVLVERELPGTPLGPPSSVRTAHDLGAAAAMAYLRDLGHEQIALISRGSTQTFAMVRAAWESAVSEWGISPRPPLVESATDRGESHWDTAELDALLSTFTEHGVTAMLCHNDRDALTIVQYAQSRGWSVPGDLSVIAYDDELASMASPPLTAIAPPKERVGALAALTLCAIIREGVDAPVRRTRVEPALVVRSSTGTPRT